MCFEVEPVKRGWPGTGITSACGWAMDRSGNDLFVDGCAVCFCRYRYGKGVAYGAYCDEYARNIGCVFLRGNVSVIKYEEIVSQNGRQDLPIEKESLNNSHSEYFNVLCFMYFLMKLIN